jgi:tripartite-type tricarboxylate transporter receptor subunit TctC
MTVRTSCILALACVLPQAAWPQAPSTSSGQAFPWKAIQVISTASPGSSGDAALRLVAARMSAALGQPVVVDIRPAARGAQMAQALARATPDGHTITFGTSGTYVNSRYLFKNVSFDVLKDFVPISLTVRSPTYVAISNALPIHSLAELIDYAKKHPGKIEYASTGAGSVFHLAGESLKLYAGIDMLHVPYAQANFGLMINDWVSGRVPLYFPAYAFLAPNLGKVRPLAVLANKPTGRMPNVPAVTDTLPQFQTFDVWWAFFAPAGTPSAVCERLASESRAALKFPDVVAKLDQLGLTAVGSTPAELDAELKRDLATVGNLVQKIGLKPE